MKKHLTGFIAGVVVSVIAFTSMPAIAASFQTIEATLNSVNIEVNGKQVSAVGEDYTLANGQKTAGSIVYNQTTYVPIRRVGELLDVEIGWNQQTGSVTIGEVPTPAPDTPSLNYNWTAEEEAAYQEFKGMWEYSAMYDRGEAAKVIAYKYNGNMSFDELCAYFKQQDMEYWYPFIVRFANENNGHVKLLIGDECIFGATLSEVVFDTLWHNGVVY